MLSGLFDMTQDSVQLVQAVVGQHQFSLAAGTVFDFYPGAQSLGQIVLQVADIGVKGARPGRLLLATQLLSHQGDILILIPAA